MIDELNCDIGEYLRMKNYLKKYKHMSDALLESMLTLGIHSLQELDGIKLSQLIDFYGISLTKLDSLKVFMEHNNLKYVDDVSWLDLKTKGCRSRKGG